MDQLKLSIIMPVYNAEKYLSLSIESVLSQSFENFELIVIDDGSTDNSRSILKRYALKDNRIKLLSKKNGGASSARNLGLKESHGEWVIFVDSDDYLPYNALSNMIERGAEIKVDLVLFSLGKLDNKGNIESRKIYDSKSFHPYREVIVDILRDKIDTEPSSKLFRGSIARQVQFDENLIIGEDLFYILNFILKSQQPIYFENTIVYVYRSISSSITHSKENLFSYKQLVEKVSELLSENDYGDYLRTFMVGTMMWMFFTLQRLPSAKDLNKMLIWFRKGISIPSNYAEYKYLDIANKSHMLANVYFNVVCIKRKIRKKIKLANSQ